MSSETNQMLHFETEETDHIRRHITAIKWIGVSFILVTVLTSPFLVLSAVISSDIRPLDYEVKAVTNQTACVYVKRYDLGERVYLTVCNLDGDIILDIRRFFNQSASIRGIPLNLNQWQVLKQVQGSVDIAINEARTYWKSLKRMDA